ncbi:Bacterial regulatory protein, tetR family [Polystyrenella longa]|uniref:Bacterial regulatory protein, tetR family n=1 Tax=Polystyrenella longa TaxID=2528007 RepID=A0A518CRE6_9PLAN|nr:TetR/AcrR family transcriptional regulator [Polystyrenella longa]QDU81785.1 Bacterial regulatory protein, tetR family [Polystyrenella longa]
MNRSPRKEREWKEREARILEVARRLLIKHGYLGLKMDQIATEMEYSKGTIYQHFSSKEDVIMELAAQTLEKRVEMMARAAEFQGRPRERMAALGVAVELFVRKFSDYFRVEQIIRADSIRDKAAPERQDKLISCEIRCMGIVTGIIRDGVAAGDLKLPEFLTAEQLAFGMWSLSFGGSSIILSGQLGELGVESPFEAIINNIQMLLDGLSWMPLSYESDYKKTMERIAEEMFSDLLEDVPLK